MNGLIFVNKQKGMTSRDVVNVAVKSLSTKKIGHTGTLDPNATGVLILCIGKYTKLVDLITGYDKEYVATVVLGLKTNTLDVTGEVIETANINNIDIKKVDEVLSSYFGTFNQQIPIYSAVKVNGMRLYEYARNNIKVDLPSKNVSIYDIKRTTDIYIKDGYKCFDFKCRVSKGTYIRSIIDSLSKDLGIIMCMGDLIRTKQKGIDLSDCDEIDDIVNKKYRLRTITDLKIDYDIYNIDKDLLSCVKNGNILNRNNFNKKHVLIYYEKEVIAIYQEYEKDNTKIKPCIIF